MKTVFVIRYSKIEEIENIQANWNTTLTEDGFQMAKCFGETLASSFKKVKIFSSPIQRCIDTGKAIMFVQDEKQDIEISNVLGTTEVFFSGNSAESFEKSGTAGVMQAINNRENPLFIDSQGKNVKILFDYIKEQMKFADEDSVSVFITHDSILAPFINYFLDENFKEEHCIESIGGLKFQFDDNIMNVSRWKGEKQNILEWHKEEIIKAGKLIYDKGYNAGNDGNLSIRVDVNHILITAGGALLGFLKKSDLILVDNQGNIVEAADNKKPSSEMAMHLGIYKERPDVNAIIHAHAPYSISLSMLDIDTEKNIYLVSCGPIPITEIAIPSSNDSWEKIKPFVKDRSKAILRRHGAVSWGKDMDTAFIKLEEVEHFAKTLVHAVAVKPIYPIDDKIKEKLFLNFWRIK